MQQNFFVPDTSYTVDDGHACARIYPLDIVYRHTPSTIKNIVKE